MVINVHAGHNPSGAIGCGAVGILDESRENRIVKDLVINKLRNNGHTVYDCTIDNGTSQRDVLKKIVSKCNAHTVDLDISIHFNSGARDANGNGVTTGTEVFVFSSMSKAKAYAQNVVNAISSLGFKNRGVKYSTRLYVLKKTKSPSMLIECCFVDDNDDAKLYNSDKMAQAIVKGITGINTTTFTTETPSATNTITNCPFAVQCLDDLNIRITPNGTIKTVNGCKKGVKYTIVKTSGNWGYLKSGAGWITILSKYVKRL